MPGVTESPVIVTVMMSVTMKMIMIAEMMMEIIATAMMLIEMMVTNNNY